MQAREQELVQQVTRLQRAHDEALQRLGERDRDCAAKDATIAEQTRQVARRDATIAALTALHDQIVAQIADLRSKATQSAGQQALVCMMGIDVGRGVTWFAWYQLPRKNVTRFSLRPCMCVCVCVAEDPVGGAGGCGECPGACDRHRHTQLESGGQSISYHRANGTPGNTLRQQVGRSMTDQATWTGRVGAYTAVSAGSGHGHHCATAGSAAGTHTRPPCLFVCALSTCAHKPLGETAGERCPGSRGAAAARGGGRG